MRHRDAAFEYALRGSIVEDLKSRTEDGGVSLVISRQRIPAHWLEELEFAIPVAWHTRRSKPNRRTVPLIPYHYEALGYFYLMSFISCAENQLYGSGRIAIFVETL